MKKKQKLKILTTSKDIRKLIIWAMTNIDDYQRFIKICEGEIKKLKDK